MYEIEKNVPIPAAAVGPKKGRSKYPCYEMEVGDSFFAPGMSKCLAGTTVFRFNKVIPGKKFASRAENNGFRIWRVE